MSDIVAAGKPVCIGGREFVMSPLTDRDISELDEWVRSRAFEVARVAARACPENERREILAAAVSASVGLSFMSGEGAKLMGTLDGVARLVFQCLKKEHPSETPESIRKLLIKYEDVDAAMAVFRSMNGSYTSKKGVTEESPSQETSST